MCRLLVGPFQTSQVHFGCDLRHVWVPNWGATLCAQCPLQHCTPISPALQSSGLVLLGQNLALLAVHLLPSMCSVPSLCMARFQVSLTIRSRDNFTAFIGGRGYFESYQSILFGHQSSW